MNDMRLLLIIAAIIVPVFIFSAYRMSQLLDISNKQLRFGIIITGLLLSLPVFMLSTIIYFGSSLQYYKQFIIDNTFLNNEGLIVVGFIVFIFIMGSFAKLLVKPINSYNSYDINWKRTNNLSIILNYPATTLKKALTAQSWGRNSPSRVEYRSWIESNRDSSPVAQWLIIFASYMFIILHILLVIILIKGKISSDDLDVNLLLIGFIPFITSLWILNKMIFFIINLTELLIANLMRTNFKIPEIIAFILFHYLYLMTIIGLFYIMAKLL